MKKLTALFVLAITLISFTGSAFAWGPSITERPEMFRPRQTRGYFIWHDKDGFHLFTTTRGQRHVFTGVIRTDGGRIEFKSRGAESNDRYRLDRNRDALSFRFDTRGDVDGVDFRVIGGKRVNFDLYMDGKKIDTQEIYIGGEGWHPGRSNFTLYK